MAPYARDSQQPDMGHFLSKVESDLRQLTRRQQRALEDTSQWQEVQVVLARLQQHREHIRQRSSTKSTDKAVQTKLAAARAKIEEATRKARELEKRCRVDSPQHPVSPSTSTVSSLGSVVPAPSSSRIAQRCDSSSSSASTASHPEVEAAEEQEVKVLAEQLVADASGDGGNVASEFVCKICQTHVVGCQPKLTTCSHLFCGDCISKWFAVQPGCQSWAGRAKGAGAVPCPVCKEPLRADKDLHPVCKGGQGGSAFLWQMLSATRIVCANHRKCNAEGCCDWEGDYGSYQEHIRSCANMPCHAAVLTPLSSSSLPTDAEAVEASAETSAICVVGEDMEGCAMTRTFSGSSSTASSLRGLVATMLETESENEDMAPCQAESECPESENSEVETTIENAGNLECTAAAPIDEVNASESPVALEQGPDLYSLIAQLVELKVSSSPTQVQQQPGCTSAPGSLEGAPSPQVSEPLPVQGKASDSCTPQGLPATLLGNKSGGGKKPAAKPKDAGSKRSQDVLPSAQLKAQSADFKALQVQAQAAQAARAAQAAYAAQWQAAWQMQAAQAMQMQQSNMAYAGRVAQWQMAQKQAAQATWAMQFARR